MAKARNSFERLATAAAERLDAARAAGEQLALLPDEIGRTAVEAGTGKVGRPKGALGKGSSQMRRWLADRGYRMPEDVLAEMAGLASGENAMLTAMRHADQVLTWAYGEAAGGKAPGPAERLSMFAQLYAAQLRAADALLPFGAAKAAPDTVVQQSVTVNVPAGPVDPAAVARDVSPKPARIGGRMVPADVAHEIEQNQDVSGSPDPHSDSESRTE